MSTFNRLINSFTDGIGHDRDIFNFNNNMNKPLVYIKPNGSMAAGIPDFQLEIENNSVLRPGDAFFPKWIGEVAFTVSPSDTRANLKQIVDSHPTVDLAFLVTIQEVPKWASPSRKDVARNLRTGPLLSFKEFIPAMAETSLGPVIVDQFTWISVTQVTIEVYLRRPNGPLNIDVDLQDDFSALGVRDHSAKCHDLTCVDRSLGALSLQGPFEGRLTPTQCFRTPQKIAHHGDGGEPDRQRRR